MIKLIITLKHDDEVDMDFLRGAFRDDVIQNGLIESKHYWLRVEAIEVEETT